ncbi:hypothetical protein cypCar_00038853 [Cyprinus carpio]|nr:hypothetical protein cypCar_00038853 [Cyprinus carpio]
MAESFPKNEKVYILLQMEYTTHNQTQSQTIQAFSNETLELCDLHPGSKYTVRLRAQDSRAHAHWSSWNSTDTTTAEKDEFGLIVPQHRLQLLGSGDSSNLQKKLERDASPCSGSLCPGLRSMVLCSVTLRPVTVIWVHHSGPAAL